MVITSYYVLKEALDLLVDFFWGNCGGKAVYNPALTVDEEFFKIPLDIIVTLAFAIETRTIGNDKIFETGLAFAFGNCLFQKTVQWGFVRSVDLDFLESRERCVVVESAKRMDCFVVTVGLLHKLVARKIEDYKSLVFVFAVKRFERCVLRRETATCGCVDYEHDLALELQHGNLVVSSIVPLNDDDVVDIHSINYRIRYIS